jgi:hypothetical protein
VTSLYDGDRLKFNPLNAELNPSCYLLELLAHHFLHVSRIRVKSLTLRLLVSYVYIYIYIYIYDISSLRFKVRNEAREKNKVIRISSFTRQLQEINHLALYEIHTANTTSPFSTEIQEIQYLDRYEVSAEIMQ